MTNYRTSILYLIILALVLVSPVYAVTTTAPITADKTSWGVTLTGAACSGDCWFEFGQTFGGPYPLHTDNISAVGGFTYALQNNPVVSNRTYYFIARDTDNSYGVERSFNLPLPTPFPTQTMGRPLNNLTRSRMNLTTMPLIATVPYTDIMTSPIVWLLVFFFIYSGLWMAQRNVSLIVILGIISSGAILFADANGLGIPAEAVGIVQGLMYASIAGIFFVLWKR